MKKTHNQRNLLRRAWNELTLWLLTFNQQLLCEALCQPLTGPQKLNDASTHISEKMLSVSQAMERTKEKGMWRANSDKTAVPK